MGPFTYISLTRRGRLFGLTYLLLAIFLPLKNIGQVSHGGTPLSFEEYEVRSSGRVPKYQVASLHNDSLLEKDPTSARNSRENGFNFGYTVSVNRNLRDDGSWETLSNNSRIGRMGITSPNAHASFLILDTFYIPKGGELFAYTEDRKQVIGSFTHENMNPGGGLSIGPLSSSSIVLEYNQPQFVDSIPRIEVSSYVHVYKKVFGTSEKTFSDRDHNDDLNSSGSCQINVQCPEGSGWCDQRRSVAMVAALNPNDNHFSSFCSGGLLTNVKRDRRPYFLTAFHCADNNKNKMLTSSELNNIHDWIFIFNYQSDDCSDPSIPPSINHTISGAFHLSGNSNSDFLLLELFSRPTGGFNSYYSGWDSRDNIPDNGALIHHPSGDIKKISLYDNAEKVTRNIEGYTVSSWLMSFSDGITEGGSSGCLAFNDNKRVIGQLSGGDHTCQNPSNSAIGRLEYSWDALTHTKDMLRPFLSTFGSPYIIAQSGDENCALSYTFQNANDLHTSANIDPLNLSSVGSRTYNGEYMASNDIEAGPNVIIQSGTSVEFEGDKVVLKSGFHAKKGSYFAARGNSCLRGCGHGRSELVEGKNTRVVKGKNGNLTSKETKGKESVDKGEKSLFIYPNPNNGAFYITLESGPGVNSDILSLELKDLYGRSVIEKNRINEKEVKLYLPGLVSGSYVMNVFDTNGDRFTKQVLIE